MLAKVISKNNQNNHLIKVILLSLYPNAANIEMNIDENRNTKVLMVSEGLYAQVAVNSTYKSRPIKSLFFRQVTSTC